MRTIHAAVLLSLLASKAGAWGVSHQGTSGAQFLKIGPSARAAAMGEAYTALCEDAYAVYYNPAGLGFLKDTQAAAMHNAYFQDIRHDFGAIAVPLLAWTDSRRERNEFGTAAFGLTSLGVSGIERRGVVETDQPTDTFGASDFAYAFGYGFPLSPALSAGAAFKVIDQTLDSAHSTAFALDAGALYRKDKLSLAGGLRNMGTASTLGTGKDPLPFLLYGGTAWRFTEAWGASADLRLPRDQRVGLSFGTEYRRKFSEDLSGALRGGYNTSTTDAEGLTGVTFGAGAAYGGVEFDFAWVPFGDLGNTFKYSLQVRF